MDKRKNSKRCKLESTNNKKNKVKNKKSDKKENLNGNEINTNQDGNQSFYEKDSDKYELEMNKAHRINTIDSNEDIDCKSLDDDVEEGWVVKINNKKKNSHQSLSEEQNNHKNIQKQSKLSNTNSKQEKAHDKNNIDILGNENTSKLITEERESKRKNKKKKKSQKQREFSDIDSSVDHTINLKKVHDEDNNNLHEECIPHLSKIDDLEEQKDHNKNKNNQKQRRFSDKDSFDDHKFNHQNVHERNKINSYEEDSLNLSINSDSKRRSKKKKNKKKSSHSSLNEELKYENVQNQSKLSNKNSIDENSQKKKSHDRKNIDSPKDTCRSITKEGEEKWKNKIKNNNGQKQSRFSDMGISVLDEIDEDIFNLPNDYSVAHCVAEDLRMGAGIAVDFKRIFGGVGKLVDQKLKIGDVGIVKRHDQYAFYLVTKKTSNGKPTIITMEKALYSLLNKMKEYNLTKLGIPKIGCGLDKLNWSDIKLLINNIFSGSGIHILVCIPSKLLESKTPPRLKVYITPKHLWEMESETIIILFIDLEQIKNKKWTDHIVDKVDAKYPFKDNLLRDVKNKKFCPGEIISYNVKNEVVICMFTTQSAYYNSIENGFKNIARGFKRYNYMAIQSGPIDYPNDNFQHIHWIVLISRSVIHSSELWLCGDVKQTKDQVYYDEYCKNVQYSMNNSFQYYSPTRTNNFVPHNFNTKETSNSN